MPPKDQPAPVCVDLVQPLSVSESKVVRNDGVALSSSVSLPDCLSDFINE